MNSAAPSPDDQHAPDDAPTDVFCPRCGYNLFGIPEVRCPECGFPFKLRHVRSLAEQYADLRLRSAAQSSACSAAGVTLIAGLVASWLIDRPRTLSAWIPVGTVVLTALCAYLVMRAKYPDHLEDLRGSWAVVLTWLYVGPVLLLLYLYPVLVLAPAGLLVALAAYLLTLRYRALPYIERSLEEKLRRRLDARRMAARLACVVAAAVLVFAIAAWRVR